MASFSLRLKTEVETGKNRVSSWQASVKKRLRKAQHSSFSSVDALIEKFIPESSVETDMTFPVPVRVG